MFSVFIVFCAFCMFFCAASHGIIKNDMGKIEITNVLGLDAKNSEVH